MKDRTVGEVIESIRQRLDRVAVTVLAVLLLVMLVPLGRDVMERLTGLDPSALVAVMVGLCIPLVFGSIRDLGRDVAEIGERATSGRTPPVPGGVGAIYPHVRGALAAASEKGSAREVKVIGLTLYTAWPHLHNWIDEGLLEGWTLHLTAIDPEVARQPGGAFSDDWADESAVQARKVKAARASCESRGCSLRLDHYDIVPAFHGFKIGDHSLIISFTGWADGQVSQPHDFYEIISADDEADRFALYADLFDRWFERLVAGGSPSTSRGARSQGTGSTSHDEG